MKKMQESRRAFLKKSAVGAGVCLTLPFASAFSAETGEAGATASAATVPTVTLNNGVAMPLAGLGTYGLKGKDGQKALEAAIATGYRLFDTAQMYKNEDTVGAAIKASGVSPREFFITTKLSSDMNFEETLKSFDASMKLLGLDVLDLLLIHSDYPQSADMYRAMEKLYDEKRIRALGISNFKAEKYTEFLRHCQVVPAVNQCQTHLFHQQKALREAMAPYKTVLESWSPFMAGRQSFFSNGVLGEVANKHGKTPAQVALRFLVEQNIVVIPKTEKPARMKENLAIFDFALDDDDRARLSALDTGKSAFGWDD